MTEELILTPSQGVAKDKISKFLNSNHRIFRLTGAAGYGKTTVIGQCLKHRMDIDKNNRGLGELPQILGIALAHKAKNVLRGSIRNCVTFAKAYGYEEVYLPNGDRDFVPKKKFIEPPLGHCEIPVFVFDEVSMFNQKMIDIMLKETPKNSKIILMGDQAQLPPPGGDERMLPDQDSPIFYMNLPEECSHELTEPVRQKAGNPILELAWAIRAEIFGDKNIVNVMNMICRPTIVDGHGYQIMKKDDVISHYIYNGNFTENKIITYENKEVEKWNVDIRNLVFCNPTAKLVDNDIIFLTDGFVVDKPKFSLNNADEYIVEKVSTDTFRVKGYDIQCHFAFIPNKLYNFPVYIVTPTNEGMKVYNEALETLQKQCKTSGYWKDFWEFKKAFTQYTMGYCINAYRAQGSTYQNVYIDIMNILKLNGWNILSDKRMLQTLYTAVTRASKTVTFIQ